MLAAFLFVGRRLRLFNSLQMVAGVPGNNQVMLADNVTINDSTTTFENADSCKKDGWQQFTTAPDPFKNQGQCVGYFAKGGQ